MKTYFELLHYAYVDKDIRMHTSCKSILFRNVVTHMYSIIIAEPNQYLNTIYTYDDLMRYVSTNPDIDIKYVSNVADTCSNISYVVIVNLTWTCNMYLNKQQFKREV